MIAGLIVDRAAAICVTVDLEAGYSGRMAARGHHRAGAGVIDLLTAAVAEQHIAVILRQPQLWVAPRGTLD